MGIFSFWESSFSGIFIKLSKEWDPPIWLVPSSNISLPVLLCLFSFFIFFFVYPKFLFSLTLHCSSISHHHHTSRHHHKQTLDWAFVFSLSFSSLCQIGFSLRHFFSLSSLLPDCHHHEQPPWATMRSVHAQPRSVHLCV